MKWNKPLVLGAVILMVLLVVSLLPGLFTDKNPYSVQTLKYTVEEQDGQSVFLSAPFAPSDRNLWGTDELGRDIYSFVIYGTRLTLKIALYVTLLRFALALPLGLFAGFKNKFTQNIIRQTNILFSGLPPLLFAVFLLYLNFFTRLDKRLSTLAFIIILTIVGFGKLASAIESTTRELLKKPYITSEYVLGKTKFDVAIENIIPHLMPEFIVMFFMEVARVLSLQIQLGLFSIFIGNLKILLSNENGIARYWNVSYEPEWASLLGYAGNRLRTSPWMVLYPAGAFFVSVLGFNLFGEGLRIKLQNQDSMFIPKVRKVISYIFLSRHRRGVKLTLKHYAIVFLIIAIIVLSFIDFNNHFEDIDYVANIPNRLYVGMDETEGVAEQLKSAMIEIGLEPLYEDFIRTYDVEPMYFVPDSQLTIGENTYSQDIDYSLHSYMPVDLKAVETIDTKGQSIYNLPEGFVENKIVLIDSKDYTIPAIKHLTTEISEAGGLGVIAYNVTPTASIGNDKLAIPLIYVQDKEMIDGLISLKYEPKPLGKLGYNIVGMLPGMDDNTGEEVLLISAPLNYSEKEDALITFNKTLSLVNAFRKDSDRTIVLAFFDGTYDHKSHGIMNFSNGMQIDPYMHIEYLNLRTLAYGDGITRVNKEQSPETRYYGVSFFQSLSKTNLEYEFFSEPLPLNPLDRFKDPSLILHHKKGIDSIVFDVYSDADTFYTALYQAIKENN